MPEAHPRRRTWRWRPLIRLLLLSWVCLLPVGVAAPAAAGTVRSATPFWFRDDYAHWSFIDPAATTAQVDTASPGTVRLPYAPLQAAFDPRGTYALVATQGGVYAYVLAGDAVTPVTPWRLGNLPATGVAWLGEGAAFALSTPSQIAIYGLDPSGTAVRVAQTTATGVVGLAPGPLALPSALLAATADGAGLYESVGGSLIAVNGGPMAGAGNLGVAATSDGAVAATWQRSGVQIWAWDGTAYLRARTWDPPAPVSTAHSIVAVTFFPQGGGYWVLGADGRLTAYAYGPAGLSLLGGWSAAVARLPNPPATIAEGWGPVAAAVVYPGGWVMEDLGAGYAFAPDPKRSLEGQAWPVYGPEATLQSTVLTVGHPVTEARIEDADCPRQNTSLVNCANAPVLPPGTALAYALSTDGCRTWQALRPFTNTPVPPGGALCYRLTISSSDPLRTPVVSVTDLYEIATASAAGQVAALLCPLQRSAPAC